MHKENLKTLDLHFYNRSFTSIMLIFGCLYFIFGATKLDAKSETFYGCKNGFQFESKQQAARCIKQQRLSFQAPQQCRKNGKLFKLKVDFRGKQDMCVANNKVNLRNEMKVKPNTGFPKSNPSLAKNNSLVFAPKCGLGFQIQIRKGKDACAKGKPEQIIAPTKKVTR